MDMRIIKEIDATARKIKDGKCGKQKTVSSGSDVRRD